MVLTVYVSCGIYTVVENTMFYPSFYVSGYHVKFDEIGNKISNITYDDGYTLGLPDSCVKCISFHDSLYFLIVTLTTVGYGEITPFSIPGKLIIICIILITIVIVPKQIDDLMRLISMQSPYKKNTYKSIEVRHIVVTGYVGLQAMKNFCEELFHKDHGDMFVNAVFV